MENGPAAGYVLFFILVILDVFMYGFEKAMEVLRTKDIAKDSEVDLGPKYRRLMKLLDFSKTGSDFIQMLTALINVGIGITWIYLAANNVSPLILFLLLSMFFILGVLLPRRFAGRLPEKWADAFVSPEEEIINMVNEGHEQGIIQASEAEMISNIFELDEKEAQDIMTQRNDINSIDAATTLGKAIEFMLENKNSRYPVYEENIDQIIGILHLKDAMRYQIDTNNGAQSADKSLKDLGDLLREAVFVPKTKNINELFRKMQSTKTHMVIVVDEYGQTEGLVAMEDILEEIVGNILDEYDTEEEFIEEAGTGEYIIEGKTPLEELEERFDISFDEDSFDTINGFMISRLDRIPEEDEEFDIDYQGYNFKILSVEHKMIQSVLVTRLSDGDIAEEESALDENDK